MNKSTKILTAVVVFLAVVLVALLVFMIISLVLIRTNTIKLLDEKVKFRIPYIWYLTLLINDMFE